MYFEYLLQVFYDSGRDIGTFLSKPIRIISKPAKKKIKQAPGPSDWSIDATDEVTLFTRVRAIVVCVSLAFNLSALKYSYLQQGTPQFLACQDSSLVIARAPRSTFNLVLADQAHSTFPFGSSIPQRDDDDVSSRWDSLQRHFISLNIRPL